MGSKRSRRRHRQAKRRCSGVRVSTDEAAKDGRKVIVEGDEVTSDDVEALKAEYCRPADPPDALIGWPENVAGHDQAAAALLDWLTSLDDDYPALEADHAWQTLTTISAAMPEHSSVSVVVELSEGHLIATLLNQNQASAVTMLHYGVDDPGRWGDPCDALVISLTADEG